MLAKSEIYDNSPLIKNTNNQVAQSDDLISLGIPTKLRKNVSAYETCKDSENIIVVPPMPPTATRKIKGDQNYLTKFFEKEAENSNAVVPGSKQVFERSNTKNKERPPP